MIEFDVEKERDKFERWIGDTFPRFEINRFSTLAGHNRAGEYIQVEVELMWNAWTARIVLFINEQFE